MCSALSVALNTFADQIITKSGTHSQQRIIYLFVWFSILLRVSRSNATRKYLMCIHRCRNVNLSATNSPRSCYFDYLINFTERVFLKIWCLNRIKIILIQPISSGPVENTDPNIHIIFFCQNQFTNGNLK